MKNSNPDKSQTKQSRKYFHLLHVPKAKRVVLAKQPGDILSY